MKMWIMQEIKVQIYFHERELYCQKYPPLIPKWRQHRRIESVLWHWIVKSTKAEEAARNESVRD